MKDLKLSKVLVFYLILTVITLTLIYFDSSFPKKVGPLSPWDIISGFLICFQLLIWMYFEKINLNNTNSYWMIIGLVSLHSGILQDLMDEFYEIEGILGELENIFLSLGVLIISNVVILRFLEEKKIKLSLLKKTETIYNKSIKDPLTGLYNRYYLEEHLESILDELADINSSISAAFIDVDNFKTVNDVYGHKKGDDLLRGVGRIISSSIRESDLAFRYGGDEFLIIFPNTEVDVAVKVTKRIKNNFKKSYLLFTKKSMNLSLSSGISNSKKSKNYKELIDRADKAMYSSKRNGKDLITIAS